MSATTRHSFLSNTSYRNSNIDDLEALVELDSKNELTNLDFTIPTLNLKPKKLLLGIKLLQKLLNCTKILQNLPNGKKNLQIY